MVLSISKNILSNMIQFPFQEYFLFLNSEMIKIRYRGCKYVKNGLR